MGEQGDGGIGGPVNKRDVAGTLVGYEDFVCNRGRRRHLPGLGMHIPP